MKKIFENSGLKLIAMFIFSISLLGLFVSGIVVAGIVRNNSDNEEQEQQVKNRILNNICYDYEQKAFDWYIMRAGGDYTQRDEKYYEQLFSENNCNFYFSIEPNNQKDRDSYPTLSNYTGDDYQYSYSSIDQKEIAGETISYEYQLSISDLCDENGEVYVYDYEALKEEYNLTDLPGTSDNQEDISTEVSQDYGTDLSEVTDTSKKIYDDGYTDITESVSLEYYDGTVLEQVLGANNNYSTGYLLGEEKRQLLEKADLSQEDVVDVTFFINEEGFPNIYVIFDNFQIEYNLWNNPEFRKDLYTFLKNRIMSKYNNFSLSNYDYNRYDNKLYMEYNCSNIVELKCTGYVKSELTALDAFASSFGLKIIPVIFNGAMPIFIVSMIFCLLSVIYIIMAAGRKKSYDGIYINTFNSIPYDIILVVYGLILSGELCLLDDMRIGFNDSLLGFFYDLIFESSYGASWIGKSLVVMLMFMVLAFATAAVISTTSVRLKTGDILKNTIVVRAVKWLFEFVKGIFRKTRKILIYLRNNVNIYFKWLGIFIVISIIEFMVCAKAENMSFMGSMWFFEKLVLTVILVIAIVNMSKLKKGAQIIASGESDYEVDTENMLWEFKKHGENLNQIRDGIQVAVDDRMKSEKMKTELITNVSHDIKTPLTSIINYVDLLSKEELHNEKAEEYIEVLQRQSAKLKKLIQDLIDASKASTGNMPVELGEMDVRVLLDQVMGESEEKFDQKGMKLVSTYHTDSTMVMADGKHMWRVFENLVVNILKYGQENTRVYIDVEESGFSKENDGFVVVEPMIKVSIKNISRDELNISGDELMERFVRGDSSRNTEGSGLGLSIAGSLMEIQGGKLQIIVDGDLFKVVLLLVKA